MLAIYIKMIMLDYFLVNNNNWWWWCPVNVDTAGAVMEFTLLYIDILNKKLGI